MKRRVLLPGCVLALLAFQVMAQDMSTAAQASQTSATSTSQADASPGMRMLRGRTFDKTSNKPVPLARIIIKGTKKGVETDANGYFTLEIPKGAVVLDIFRQDYQQRDVLVPATQKSVNIPLDVNDGVLINDMAIASGIFGVTASTEGFNLQAPQDNQANRMADVDPNGIESLELHQAVAAATLSSSKASNEVAIINTQRGHAGQGPKVDITLRAGMYTLAKKLGVRRFTSEAEAAEAFGEIARAYYRQGQFYDHEAELASRRDLSTEAVASVTGVAGDTRYSGSALVRDDNGIVANTGYEKQSFRLNVGHKMGELDDVNLSANLIHSRSDLGLTNDGDPEHTDLYMELPSTPSFFNLQPDANGKYPRNPFVSSRINPLRTPWLLKNEESRWSFIISGAAIYKLETSEFKLLANLALDRYLRHRAMRFPPGLDSEPSEYDPWGTSLQDITQAGAVTFDFNMVYHLRPAGSGLIANSSAGISLDDASGPFYIVSHNLASGQLNPKWIGLGYYVQEEMILLDERLTLLGALRGEQGTSASDGLLLYPKLATAFRVPTLHPLVDEFKVRLSYVKPSRQVRYWQRFSPLQVGNSIDRASSIIGSGITRELNIISERQREVEASMDAVFAGGKIVTELSLYQHDFSGVQLPQVVSPYIGFFRYGGSLRNRGVEVMVQLNPLGGGEFEWVSNTTFALNRSKVMDLPTPAFRMGISRWWGLGTTFRVEEGASVTQIVGNSGLKEDGTCCVVKKLGDTEPDFRMGFSNTFKYRSWSLSFLLDWQKGGDVINLTRFIYDLAQNSPDYVGAGEQRLKDQATNAGVYVEDASFLKLREITLTYQQRVYPHRILGARSGGQQLRQPCYRPHHR
jgi:TonB-dependent starch-binding outer membrane protein SusC